MKKILVVDDSALMRRVLCDIIEQDKNLKVVDKATNGLEALELIKKGKYSKKEIVKMVGFTSERNFYRVLKKYEEENGEISQK